MKPLWLPKNTYRDNDKEDKRISSVKRRLRRTKDILDNVEEDPKPESYNTWRNRVYAYIEVQDRYFFKGRVGRRRDFFFECFGRPAKQTEQARKYNLHL